MQKNQETGDVAAKGVYASTSVLRCCPPCEGLTQNAHYSDTSGNDERILLAQMILDGRESLCADGSASFSNLRMRKTIRRWC